MKPQEIDGVRVMYERRRYGTTTYTWLLYWAGETIRWESYGDPWPSVVIPKAQLAKAIADIQVKLAKAA